jgi:hypothetical protein
MHFTNVVTYTVRLLGGGGRFEILGDNGSRWRYRTEDLMWYLEQLGIGCDDDHRRLPKELLKQGESKITVTYGRFVQM